MRFVEQSQIKVGGYHDAQYLRFCRWVFLWDLCNLNRDDDDCNRGYKAEWVDIESLKLRIM